jgi:ACS family tartrate transporter-like MFS transporter
MAGKIGERIVIDSAIGLPAEGISENEVFRKVGRRLIPFLFVLYVANILDRANVSFARFEMLSDLRLGEEVYGWAATFCFYLGYLLFEVPSNLILHRVGARRWISRIMVSWGIVSTCTMLVNDASSFYLVRILLGVAEAGFFPGIVLYLSYWFPARERARAVACFMMASPLAGAFGGLVSGNVLRYTDHAMGLAGWQWLFLIEGIPSVILGIVTWWYLTDRPKDAGWLLADERDWLADRMALEEKHSEARHGLNRLATLADPKVGLFILLYFTIALGSNGFGFYAPEILKRQFVGWKADGIGYLYLIPNLTTAVVMFLIGSHSDRTGERRWHLAACAFLAAIGWALSATLQSPWMVLFALTMAQVGMISMIGPFWSFATSFLSGLGAVGGIALINTIANTGGAFSSPLMSWLEKVSGSFATGQLILAGTMLVGGGLALCIRDRPAEQRPETRDEKPPIGAERVGNL